eukprot:CAMPEP_0114110348 /NCGR_PEP_ID=MMETSP0043_2-20121206/1264_1 /TAXON_ID=464988 /ORGANISM="Hemiselmis andersenii, Strain CCMP644" /LENGTH=127 /DNA_ID=CAMNT_0001202291 /DNA_START=578 /DNA_END=961 /DNA_ORIENTATION=-
MVKRDSKGRVKRLVTSSFSAQRVPEAQPITHGPNLPHPLAGRGLHIPTGPNHYARSKPAEALLGTINVSLPGNDDVEPLERRKSGEHARCKLLRSRLGREADAEAAEALLKTDQRAAVAAQVEGELL